MKTKRLNETFENKQKQNQQKKEYMKKRAITNSKSGEYNSKIS
jgi:hypothetical protein